MCQKKTLMFIVSVHLFVRNSMITGDYVLIECDAM